MTERENGTIVNPTGRREIALSDIEMERLGHRLFEYQESILPEGENWENMAEGERGFWTDSAQRVLWELEIILGKSHNRDA